MTTQPVEPTPVDLAGFSDEQLAAMLSLGGRAHWIAADELARRHPLSDTPTLTPAQQATQPPPASAGS